jgi:hypothetical protein
MASASASGQGASAVTAGFVLAHPYGTSCMTPPTNSSPTPPVIATLRTSARLLIVRNLRRNS